MNIQVENLNGYANQFHIIVGTKSIFQSYSSIIVVIDTKAGTTTLDKYYWNYSVTTSRHRNKFLGEDTATTQAKIKSGEYKLQDLNK